MLRVPWKRGPGRRTASGFGGSWVRQKVEKGYFGPYGGRYVPETLIHALEELEEAYERYKDDPEFVEELDSLSRDFVGRPTDRKSTRLNSSHANISYAVFCLKKKKKTRPSYYINLTVWLPVI